MAPKTTLYFYDRLHISKSFWDTWVWNIWKKTPPPLILGTYCPDRAVQGTLNSQLKQTFCSAFTLRVVQERDKSWWILFSYVIGNYFLSVVCSLTCYSGYFCNEFTKFQHCFRIKIMHKRDKNTSAQGIEPRMPSFTVIGFKSWHFCAPSRANVDASHLLL